MIKELIITYLPGLSLTDFEEVASAIHAEYNRRNEIRSRAMPTPNLNRELSHIDNVKMYCAKYNCDLRLAILIVRKHW